LNCIPARSGKAGQAGDHPEKGQDMNCEEITHDESYYHNLTRNLVIKMIIASFTPLILITFLTSYKYNNAYKSKVIAHIQELVEKHKQNIDNFLKEKLANILFLSRTCSLPQLSDENALQGKLQQLREEYGPFFVDIGLINAEGIQTDYVGPFNLGRVNYSQAEWFREAMEKEYYISDVFLGIRGMPHFIIAIRKTHGDKEWIVRTTIDFVLFNELVKNIRIGKTGRAFIVNRQGELQTKLQADQPDTETIKKHILSKNIPDKGVEVFTGSYSADHQSIYLVTTLNNGKWVLIFQQDEKDAFSDLYETRNLGIVIFLLGSCSIFVMAIFLSRKMVAQIKKSDQEKEMMNEQIIEAGKLASLGELAAGIAHEINNPVAIMVEEAGWMGDILQEEEFKDSDNFKEYQRALTQIRNQGIRCKEITHKLLSFARKIDSRIQDVQLNTIIEEVVGLSEKRARYGNVEIISNLAPNLPTVHVSPSEMQQVFLNLINNAVDAIDSKKGGTITLSTRLEDQKIVVDIEDTGSGIARANLQRIFDPFFTTKAVGKGTGLGLSICYGIIKKIGGEISVNSAVGKGTVFHIHIPVARQDT
jgi:two-component system NtrC family sensor kinase